jgi:hypothetical protein
MTARRDGGWTQSAFSDGPVHRLLADTQEPRCFFRADEVSAPESTFEAAEAIDVLREEAAMAARSDHGRPEQPSCHGAKNGRPAHTQAVG